jgi:hypothetical protein
LLYVRFLAFLHFSCFRFSSLAFDSLFTVWSKFVYARFLVLLQDDDAPKTETWLKEAVRLFAPRPKMALLGGFGGRLDYGTRRLAGQVDIQ